MSKTIHIKNNTFILHPSASVFWEERNMLLISDVHLGKVSHFRKHGVAIPENSILRNFERLDSVLEYFNPEKVIFLGDLFHSKKNQEWKLFTDWIQSKKVEIILVAGNHDVIDQKHYELLNVKVVSEITSDGFFFTHHPEERDDFFNFCGHIHPAIELRGIGRQFIKLPCFFKRPNQMIFPAFGEFTGNYYLIPTEKDKVYAITKEDVIEIALN